VFSLPIFVSNLCLVFRPAQVGVIAQLPGTQVLGFHSVSNHLAWIFHGSSRIRCKVLLQRSL